MLSPPKVEARKCFELLPRSRKFIVLPVDAIVQDRIAVLVGRRGEHRAAEGARRPVVREVRIQLEPAVPISGKIPSEECAIAVDRGDDLSHPAVLGQRRRAAGGSAVILSRVVGRGCKRRVHRAEKLQVRRLVRLFHIARIRRRADAGQNAHDRDDHDKLDQRKAALPVFVHDCSSYSCFFLSFPAAGSVRCLFQRFAPIAPLIVRA